MGTPMASSRRRSSLASSVVSSAVSAGAAPPPKSYLERLSAMLAALLHSSTPIVLLKQTLRLHEIIMGMENEEGADAREEGCDVLNSAFAITKRCAEMPYEGEQLRPSHMDAILAYMRVVIAKYPAGPDAFPYLQTIGVVRANCVRLLMQAVDERGIEDVTEHTYDLHEYIQLLLHRFVFRHDQIYREFRSHVEKFTINFEPAATEDVEEEENMEDSKRESPTERKERLETTRLGHYRRFVAGCMLLRLSSPEARKEIIKEKKNEKARRSIQADINTAVLFTRLEEWKEAMEMDEGTETILRDMIGRF